MDKCIIWTGKVWAQGRYGMTRLNGRNMGAHRAAWIVNNGKIPRNLLVCHRCDNGLCVNINHLFLGAMKENMADCISKGRFPFNRSSQKGEKNRNAKPNLIVRNKEAKRMRKDGHTYSKIKQALNIRSNGHLRSILISDL